MGISCVHVTVVQGDIFPKHRCFMSEILGGAVRDLVEGRRMCGQRLFGLETRPSGFVRKALTLHIVCEGGGGGGREGGAERGQSRRQTGHGTNVGTWLSTRLERWRLEQCGVVVAFRNFGGGHYSVSFDFSESTH